MRSYLYHELTSQYPRVRVAAQKDARPGEADGGVRGSRARHTFYDSVPWVNA